MMCLFTLESALTSCCPAASRTAYSLSSAKAVLRQVQGRFRAGDLVDCIIQKRREVSEEDFVIWTALLTQSLWEVSRLLALFFV